MVSGVPELWGWHPRAKEGSSLCRGAGPPGAGQWGLQLPSVTHKGHISRPTPQNEFSFLKYLLGYESIKAQGHHRAPSQLLLTITAGNKETIAHSFFFFFFLFNKVSILYFHSSFLSKPQAIGTKLLGRNRSLLVTNGI